MSSDLVNQLREKHPTFYYRSYGIARENENLLVTHKFEIDPDLVFESKLVISNPPRDLPTDHLHNFVFQLGLVEMISYWKATCSPRIVVEAGALRYDQMEWWKNLFIYGLGEFFYRNQIDFSDPTFLTIASTPTNYETPSEVAQQLSGNLILVSGGKDSSVMLETLKPAPTTDQLMLVNPTQAALDQAQIAGFTQPLILNRSIDPRLIELNKQGYLNGHTPFSAYLAFAGVFMAELYEKKHVIVANEKSASDGNTTYLGIEINHQYSKSYTFESKFRQYAQKYLNPEIEYFSLLRPIYDLQVGQLFSKFSRFHHTFRSCNVGQKENKWCGTCPKCAFVYLSLFPFFSYDEIIQIFGSDFFLNAEIAFHLRGLVGLEKEKPFECVGTEEESLLALALSIQKYLKIGRPLPPILDELQTALNLHPDEVSFEWKDKILDQWSTDHFLPPDFETLLHTTIDSIKQT